MATVAELVSNAMDKAGSALKTAYDAIPSGDAAKKLVKDYSDYLKNPPENSTIKNIKDFAAEKAAAGSAYASGAVDSASAFWEANAPKEVKDLAGQVMQGGRAMLGGGTPTPPAPGAPPGGAPEGAGNGIMDFLSNNKGGLMAGVLAAVVGMAAAEMGLIGALLVGLLAFAVVGGMADKNGLIGNMMGGNKGPQVPNYRAPSAGLSPTRVPVPPEQVKSYSLQNADNQIIAGQDANGKPKYAAADKDRIITVELTGSDGKPLRSFTGKVKLDGANKPIGFIVTGVQERMSNGALGPVTDVTTGADALSEADRTLTATDGKVDFDSPALGEVRKKAEAKAKAYEKPVELEVKVAPGTMATSVDREVTYATVSMVPPGSPTGTAEKVYTVVLKGKIGENNQFKTNTAIVMDGADPVKGLDGKPIEVNFTEQTYTAKRSADGTKMVIEEAAGIIGDWKKTVVTAAVTKQNNERTAATAVRDKQKNEFVKSYSEATAIEVNMLSKWSEKIQADMAKEGPLSETQKSQITAAAIEIGQKYRNPDFVKLDPATAAIEIKKIIKSKGLNRPDGTADGRSPVAQEDLLAIHEGIRDEFNRKDALSNQVITKDELEGLTTKPGTKTDEVTRALASMNGPNGYIILTPEADGTKMGPVIYAQKGPDGKFKDIQVAREDGKIVRVKGDFNFADGKPALDKILVHARSEDANLRDEIKEPKKDATILVDDIIVPLTRTDLRPAREAGK